MKDVKLKLISQREIAEDTFEAVLSGDVSDITAPGQFVNIKLEGHFLRRPISVCDVSGDTLTIIYKVVGEGTRKMSRAPIGTEWQTLTGLGNGYDTSVSGDHPLLIGGGAGVPPMYMLCKKLIAEGKTPSVILGFGTKNQVFYKEMFTNLGVSVAVTTNDGSEGTHGFVTDVMDNFDYTYFYTCGPEPMLKAIYNKSKTSGQFSFEERMGCGFGACMGCTCETKYGNKRICRDGPVLVKEEIIW
jgi:dihydroorotate dehydrogenase electron transfer subunit